ncbi:MAG: hypothetical protein M1309_01565 [Actinobacteria bacterium]|nr:hypothetical protein [Actinomycetota bacterium]
MSRDPLSWKESPTSPQSAPPSAPAPAASVYEAWESARRDIYDEWMFSTDPANIQPSIRPLFLRAADHLRQHPPAGSTQAEIDEAVEALEAPGVAGTKRLSGK